MLCIGVWLYFICCPLQGGSILQPAHEPVVPKPVPLNFDPLLPPPFKKLFLDLGLGRPMALSVGQLPDEVTGSSSASTASTACSRAEEEAEASSFWGARVQRSPSPAGLPACQRQSRGGRGGTTSQPPEIPAAAELEELKELYKGKKTNKNKRTLKHDRTTCHTDFSCPKEQQTHYMHSRSKSYIGSPLEPFVCTHHSIKSTRTQRHTSINAHQYKR